MPPNAKAANNDKATANMRPSAVATARGKPSDFMAAYYKMILAVW